MATYNIHFMLEKRKDKNGNPRDADIPVLFSIAFDGKRFKSTTGLKCPKFNQWSEGRERFKPSATNSLEKNKLLDQLADKLEKSYLDLKGRNDYVSLEMFKSEFKGEPDKGFWDYFNDFVRDEGSSKGWASSTYAKYKTLRGDLEQFEKERKKPFDFISIDHDWYQQFFNFLSSKSNRNTTIKHKFKFLNQFLKWAIEKKGVKVSNFDCFKVKVLNSGTKTGTHLNMVFLNLQEFLVLLNAEIPNERLTKVRDIFVFLSATGMHISQYLTLKESDIANGSITYVRDKTTDPIQVPLNEFSQSIITKYTVTTDDGDKRLELPKMADSNINIYLKELAKILGFDRLITETYLKSREKITEVKHMYEIISTKAGRKTFITLSISLKMNHEILMRFVGHKDYATLRAYLGVIDDDLTQEMGNFSTEKMMKKLRQKTDKSMQQ